MESLSRSATRLDCQASQATVQVNSATAGQVVCAMSLFNSTRECGPEDVVDCIVCWRMSCDYLWYSCLLNKLDYPACLTCRWMGRCVHITAGGSLPQVIAAGFYNLLRFLMGFMFSFRRWVLVLLSKRIAECLSNFFTGNSVPNFVPSAISILPYKPPNET